MKTRIVMLLCLMAVPVLGQDFNSAVNLVKSEQYEEAEKMFEALLTKEPANGNLYYYYGEALLKDYLSDTFSNSLEQFANQAEQLFQRGLQQAPGNALNLVGMGAVTLLRTSDTTKAQSYFNQAEATIPIKKKQIKPTHAVLLTKMAEAQLYSKVINYPRALSYIAKATAIDPTNPEIFVTLGDIYISQNDASKALPNYNKALSLDQTSPVPKIKIGNIYMRVPNLNAARPYFEEAREIDPDFAPVYRSLGELYTKAGMHDLAKQNYEKFIELSGNNTPAMVRYGTSLFQSRDYAGALEVIEEVLKVDQSRNYLNRIAGYSCYEMKPQDLEKGISYMEIFFNNVKNEDEIIARDYSYYAKMLYRTSAGDSLKMRKSFDQYMKAYALDSNDIGLVTEMAMNFYNGRWYEGAIRMFNRKAALKGEEDLNDVMYIGRCYYQLDMLPEADSIFSKIIAAQPDNIQGYLYLARTYSKMDPSSEKGLAAPKFQNMIDKIGTETQKYKTELYEAYRYMCFYNLQKNSNSTLRSWAEKMENLDPANKSWQLDALQYTYLSYYNVKDYINARATYQKVLALDPNNAQVRQTIEDLTKVINMERNLR